MNVKGTEQFPKKKKVLNRYFKYILKYNFLKFTALVILLGITIIFIQQNKCIFIEEYEINLISLNDNESAILIKKENFQYDIVFNDTVPQFHKIMQVSFKLIM